MIVDLGAGKNYAANDKLSAIKKLREEIGKIEKFTHGPPEAAVKKSLALGDAMITKATGEITSARYTRLLFGASGGVNRARAGFTSTKAKHAGVIRASGARGAGYRAWLT